MALSPGRLKVPRILLAGRILIKREDEAGKAKAQAFELEFRLFIPHTASFALAFPPLLDMQVRGVLHPRTIPVRFPKLLSLRAMPAGTALGKATLI
jgi:hypothetical protein